jgi:hypothetical protein
MSGNPVFDLIANDVNLHGPTLYATPGYIEIQGERRAGVFAVFESVVVFESEYSQLLWTLRRNICDVTTRRLFGRRAIELSFEFLSPSQSWESFLVGLSKEAEAEVRNLLPVQSVKNFLDRQTNELRKAASEGAFVDGAFWRKGRGWFRTRFDLSNFLKSQIVMITDTNHEDLPLSEIYAIREIDRPDLLGALPDAKIGSLPPGLFKYVDAPSMEITQLFFTEVLGFAVAYLFVDRSDQLCRSIIEYLKTFEHIGRIYPLPRTQSDIDEQASRIHVRRALETGYSKLTSYVKKYAPEGDDSHLICSARAIGLGRNAAGGDTFHPCIVAVTEKKIWSIPHVPLQVDVEPPFGSSGELLRSFDWEEILDCLFTVESPGWQSIRILTKSDRGETTMHIFQFWGESRGTVVARTIVKRVRLQQTIRGRPSEKFFHPSDEAILLDYVGGTD